MTRTIDESVLLANLAIEFAAVREPARRRRAVRRARVVAAWLRYRRRGHDRRAGWEEAPRWDRSARRPEMPTYGRFLLGWNRGGGGRPVRERTLRTWIGLYLQGGLAAMADRWHRIGESRRLEAAGRFDAALSAVEQRLAQDRAASVAGAYWAVRGELVGVELPSLRTVQARLRERGRAKPATAAAWSSSLN